MLSSQIPASQQRLLPSRLDELVRRLGQELSCAIWYPSCSLDVADRGQSGIARRTRHDALSARILSQLPRSNAADSPEDGRALSRLQDAHYPTITHAWGTVGGAC